MKDWVRRLDIWFVSKCDSYFETVRKGWDQFAYFIAYLIVASLLFIIIFAVTIMGIVCLPVYLIGKFSDEKETD